MTRTIVFVAAVALSWTGFFVHNIADLPGQSILSPESLFPTIVYAALLALWFVPRARTVATWALLVWGVLHLVGGAVLSVLPLPTLPFAPDQSVYHYAFHGLYGVLQVPLIVLSAIRLRRQVPR